MKKRILFLISRFLDGGIDTVLVEYLRNLDPQQYDVTLAIATGMDELEVHLNKLPSFVKVVHLVKGPLTHYRKEKIRRKLPIAKKLTDEILLNPVRRTLIRYRLSELTRHADLVVDFDSTFYNLLKSTIHRPGRPEIVGYYHFSIAENMRLNARRVDRQMAGMAGYDRIILLCEEMKKEAEKIFPEMASKFEIIYNGYNLEKFRERAIPIPEAFPSRPYFLSVARLEESQKDNSSLIRAYSVFINQFSDDERKQLPQLRLIGKGKDLVKLEGLVRELNLERDVIFMGFQQNPAPWISRAEALILSSRYEGLPTVLIEAQILGRPIVATDCPTGPAEILEGGKSGILLPVGDVPAMAEALRQLATDPSLRERLSIASLQAAERFDIRKSIQRLLS